MKRLALGGSLRLLIVKLHRWSGLALLACLLIAGLTGTWLAFRDELDAVINPELRVVEPRGEPMGLSEVYALVEAHVPEGRVSTVTLQRRPHDALLVYLRSADAGAGPLRFNLVFVDPYRRQILGQRSTTRVDFTRASTDTFVVRLHDSLLLQRPGEVVMGLAAAIWLITSLVGLALTWPVAWRRLAGWIPVLSIRRYKVNYDLHRSVGVVTMPLVVVLAISSVYLSFGDGFRATVNTVLPLTPRPTDMPRQAGPLLVSPEDALARGTATLPPGRVNSISRDMVRGWYSVRVHRPEHLSPSGDDVAYIDFTTGNVSATRLSNEATAGDRVITWQFPLHSGGAFGRPGQAVIAITGITIVAVSVTGLVLWWKGWRHRARAKAHAATARAPRGHGRVRAAARERVVLEPATGTERS